MSSLSWVDVTKRVLHIFDLVDFDRDANALVSSFIEATEVSSRIHKVGIALDDL